MCGTELWWIGAYTGQSADIKPNANALPLSRLSHETKAIFCWQNSHVARLKWFRDTLGILGDTQPRSLGDTQPCSPDTLVTQRPAAPLPGWHTTLQAHSLGDTQPCSPTAWGTHNLAAWVTHSPAPPSERDRPLAAVLLLGWISPLGTFSHEHKEVAGSSGLLWKLKHLITFEGILESLQGTSLSKSSLFHRESLSSLM